MEESARTVQLESEIAALKSEISKLNQEIEFLYTVILGAPKRKDGEDDD